MIRTNFTLLVVVLFLIVGCGGNEPASAVVPAQVVQEVVDLSSETAVNINQSALGFLPQKLDINTVSAAELIRTIPDFSEGEAAEVEAHRPFASIQQFRNDIGSKIGSDKAAEYEQYVYVPINVNESDADTLAQIPGLDVDEAGVLFGKRPFNTTNDFIYDLSNLVTETDLALATAYLLK